MRRLMLPIWMLVVGCQGLEKGVDPRSGGGTFTSHLYKGVATSFPNDSLRIPLDFSYFESKTYIGDSAVVLISPRRDTLMFSYASFNDGSSSSVNLSAFGEFKLYKTGRASYELVCAVQETYSDVRKSGAPERFSLNVIAIPAKPLPFGTYKLVVSKVIPNRFPVKTYETMAGVEKALHEDPEYEVLESWIGDLKL